MNGSLTWKQQIYFGVWEYIQVDYISFPSQSYSAAEILSKPLPLLSE